jgi:hypothetical protein
MSQRSVVRGAVIAALVAGLAFSGIAIAKALVLQESEVTPGPGAGRNTAGTVWFQGFLATATTGDPVNATYTVVARIYDDASSGSLLWGPETHAGVAITNGWFNIELGSITSPLPAFDDPPYYLQLHVNGESLSPRLKLASVPSAIQSATSDLVPFDVTYTGASNAIKLVHSGSNSADAINVMRTSSTSGAYAIYANSSAPTATIRGYQTDSDAVTTAPVLDLDIAYAANASPVVDANTSGAGPAYYGTSDGLYAVDVSTSAYDAPDDESVHVVHAVYSGGGRTGGNVAVYGEALDDVWGLGGNFVGSGVGVWGTASPPPSGNTVCYGVLGEAITENAGMNVGVRGTASGAADGNYAGLFGGNVDVDGTLTKNAGSFKIDHPLDPANKYLSHSFVESPDMMNVYNGNVELDGAGEAWVELPEWFEALNQDFRYQLTCIGGFAPVYIADEISGNRFRIAGGEPGLRVSWQVTGIRHDPYAEAHRIPVEEAKPARELGRYRNPELYGMPVSAAVHYDERVAKAAARETARGRRETEPEAPEGVDLQNR